MLREPGGESVVRVRVCFKTYWAKLAGNDVQGTWSVTRLMASRPLLIAAIVGCVVLTPLRAHAQWWGARGPADFEECADSAEKAATREAKTAALSECNSKFAGRRKPGGGYTYFDFMQ